MSEKKKAICYVVDIPVSETDIVISRDLQRKKIERYAAAEGIEITAVFEDEVFSEDFEARPGVMALLDGCDGVDMVLVERVWCFSRKMKDLIPFVEKLEKRGVRLVGTSCLWDCVSQQVRHRHLGSRMKDIKDRVGELKVAA